MSSKNGKTPKTKRRRWLGKRIIGMNHQDRCGRRGYSKYIKRIFNKKLRQCLKKVEE